MLVKLTAQTPYNTRVPIIDEDEFVMEDSFFEDDDDNNDQYLARDTIKSRFAEITGNQKTSKNLRQSAKEWTFKKNKNHKNYVVDIEPQYVFRALRR